MPQFIINKNAQANGDHEVHNATNGCTFMPETNSQINLVAPAKFTTPASHSELRTRSLIFIRVFARKDVLSELCSSACQ